MKQASVEAICVSAKKGMIKREVESVIFKEGWGIQDDAHAGDWHRQVSLLAGESIDTVKEKLPSLKNGAFAENIVTRNIDLSQVKIGDQLLLGGEVLLEITQIGKKCHNDGCVIKKATGNCIMPKEGLFAKVLQGGSLAKGADVSQTALN